MLANLLQVDHPYRSPAVDFNFFVQSQHVPPMCAITSFWSFGLNLLQKFPHQQTLVTYIRICIKFLGLSLKTLYGVSQICVLERSTTGSSQTEAKQSLNSNKLSCGGDARTLSYSVRTQLGFRKFHNPIHLSCLDICPWCPNIWANRKYASIVSLAIQETIKLLDLMEYEHWYVFGHLSNRELLSALAYGILLYWLNHDLSL